VSDSDRLILIGRVAGPFGVRGELRIAAYGEDPLALLRYRRLLREDGAPVLTLTGGRAAKGELIARAEEVADRTAVEALKGCRLYVPRAALPEPEEDEFYLADLIGLEVRAPDGAALGRVSAVHDFGAGDVLEIAPPDGAPPWMAPFTKASVPEVRIAEGWLVANPPPE
jgi:16S rRNA processing protein RimM